MWRGMQTTIHNLRTLDSVEKLLHTSLYPLLPTTYCPPYVPGESLYRLPAAWRKRIAWGSYEIHVRNLGVQFDKH